MTQKIYAGLKTAIHSKLRHLGVQVIRMPLGASEYEVVKPLASYSPWNSAPGFQSVYRQIQNNTLVDIYRCWELWTLVEQTTKLRGAILEVGVWRGGSGALIAKRASIVGIYDPVYLCDTFEGVVNARGNSDTAYRGGEHSDTSPEVVEKLLRRLDIGGVRILKGVFPEQTASLIPRNEKFRLCHIDVDSYQSAKDVMNWVWPRLVPCGVVVFDDYGFCGCEGVKALINEQMHEPGRLVIHNLNGHAIVVKLPAAVGAPLCPPQTSNH